MRTLNSSKFLLSDILFVTITELLLPMGTYIYDSATARDKLCKYEVSIVEAFRAKPINA